MKKSKYNIPLTIDNNKYIYNGLTKAFVKEEAFKHVDIDSEIKSELCKNGFLVDSNFNETETLEYLYNKKYFDSKQLTIIVTPTWLCNFKCPYCCENNVEPVMTKTNYFEVLRKFTDQYFKNYNHIHISLFGGEPLLLSNEIFDYLDYVQSLQSEHGFEYSTSITTNGSLVDTNILELLNKHNCRSMQITLDGNEDRHDKTRIFKNGETSFNLLIEKIKLSVNMLNKQCNFVLRFNLENIEAEDLRSTLVLFDEIERKRIQLLYRLVYNTEVYKNENSNTFSSLKSFYDLGSSLGFQICKSYYNYKQCEAGGDTNIFYILPDLSIWKCINDLTIKEACIGSINTEGKLMFDMNNFIRWYQASNCFKDEKCIDCSMLPDCLGGCILYKIKNGKRACRDYHMFSLPYLY